MRLRSLVSFAIPSVLLFACLDAPRFGDEDDDESVVGGSASAHAPPGMVLVPAATLAGNGTITPATKPEPPPPGKGKDKDKDKDKDKKDAGKPPPSTPPGTPPPSTPPGTPPPETPPPSTPADPTVVASFWIDAMEVSATDYTSCVAAGACSATPKDVGCTGLGEAGDHPANCVTQAQAADYCTWQRKRLPRSVEWTVAASGAGLRRFPWGPETPDAVRLNACGAECAPSAMYAGSDGFARTAPRGTFAAGKTPDGIYDLAGNVAEWVALSDGPVIRGGSFEDVTPSAVAVDALSGVATNAVRSSIGFRCARDANAP